MITWSEIEAEADASGYRERLVAVFRKYEGQPTDETTEQGHIVKVTMTSFARHMGIPDTTFRHWLDIANRAVSDQDQERLDAAKARKVARELIDPQKRAEIFEALKTEDPEILNDIRDDALEAQIGEEAAKRRKEAWERSLEVRENHRAVQADQSGLQDELHSRMDAYYDAWHRQEEELIGLEADVVAAMVAMPRMPVNA